MQMTKKYQKSFKAPSLINRHNGAVSHSKMENPVLLSDNEVPKTMAQALDWEDPAMALRNLSIFSGKKAKALALELTNQLHTSTIQSSAVAPPSCNDTLMASADSISHSLTKIASGGSQASQEIRTLEQEKRDLERHAQDVETALQLRTIAYNAKKENLKEAALAIQEYHTLEQMQRLTPRALAYAGESSLHQVHTCITTLKHTLLQTYTEAVRQQNLQVLGELTPFLQMVQLEQQGVELYLQYLETTMETEWNKNTQTEEDYSGIYANGSHLQSCRIHTSSSFTHAQSLSL